jgi:hypothetical protein
MVSLDWGGEYELFGKLKGTQRIMACAICAGFRND